MGFNSSKVSGGTNRRLSPVLTSSLPAPVFPAWPSPRPFPISFLSLPSLVSFSRKHHLPLTEPTCPYHRTKARRGGVQTSAWPSTVKAAEIPKWGHWGHSPAQFLANWLSPWPNSRQAPLSPFCDSAPLMGVICQSPDVASILLSQSSGNPLSFLPDNPRYLIKPPHPPPCRRARLITQFTCNKSPVRLVWPESLLSLVFSQ